MIKFQGYKNLSIFVKLRDALEMLKLIEGSNSERREIHLIFENIEQSGQTNQIVQFPF